jgi:hypothetical protein
MPAEKTSTYTFPRCAFSVDQTSQYSTHYKKNAEITQGVNANAISSACCKRDFKESDIPIYYHGGNHPTQWAGAFEFDGRFFAVESGVWFVIAKCSYSGHAVFLTYRGGGSGSNLMRVLP